MRFEHVIQVNSPQDGRAVQTISATQVWQGLWMRVWCPDRLPNGPASCDCSPLPDQGDGAQRLARVLKFGQLVFHDQVTLNAGRSVQFRPEAHDETAPIGLTITLDEPLAGQPRLTFVYEALAPLSEEEALYSGYRQNAWRHADHDMVDMWRQWLAQGVWPVDNV